MGGADFLHLAVRLSGGATEAEWRSAVSRAYYGAFHLALNFVESCGVTLPKTADAHEKLQWCLAEAVYRHAFEGEPLDPEVRRRVRERAARISEEIRRTHGLIDDETFQKLLSDDDHENL